MSSHFWYCPHTCWPMARSALHSSIESFSHYPRQVRVGPPSRCTTASKLPPRTIESDWPCSPWEPIKCQINHHEMQHLIRRGWHCTGIMEEMYSTMPSHWKHKDFLERNSAYSRQRKKHAKHPNLIKGGTCCVCTGWKLVWRSRVRGQWKNIWININD